MADLCPVEKNKEYIMSVTDIGNDGEGIGHIEGFAVFVKDALPGEKIRVKITKANKKLAYGRLMEIIEHSEYRTEPECPVFKRLLPCIIGVIAAILFFMERDNDTFKNLRTIPVTSTQMVLAKIIVLFIFGIVFCVASTIATILCGIGTLEVYGIGYKLFLAVETGIFITAGTLPLIVLVVFFSKTYVFSILLCVFYSVLNMSATALFDTLPKTMLWLLPTPLTTFWSAGDMAAHGIKMDLEQMTGLIPSTFQVVFILGIMALVSFLLIDRLYKQRGE